MKTKITVIALIVLLSGCNTEMKKENAALKEQTLKLKQENENFQSQNKKLTTSIESYKKTMKEIDDNLKAVDINTTMVGKLGKEGSGTDTKANIMSRIASIKALIDNSKLKVIALDKSLNEMRKKFGEQSEEVLQLNKEIKEQTRLILEKEAQFLVMKSEMEEDMEELQQSYDQQVALTQQLGEIMNRAYYFSGSYKQLKEKQIVDKEGGFIGLGRVKVLNANAEDKSFMEIKKDATDTLTFAGKSVKLITEHTDGSYTVNSTKEATQLVITDKKAFWRAGNYLIVQAN